jgi:hypothetical protein
VNPESLIITNVQNLLLRITPMVQRNKLERYLFVFLAFIIFSLFVNVKIGLAKSDNLLLEVEQHWDTYGVGGTCIAGSHNLAVADVDGDGAVEIITGGFSYNMANETRTSLGAPLRIWSWNGENITLEKGENWSGNIGCVFAGDANGDGEIEILTAGGSSNNTGGVPSLRIWNWNGQNLVLRGNYAGVTASSIFVGDVDKDNMPEILTVGRAYNLSETNAQLRVWRWDGENLTLKASAEWSPANDIARANSVYAADLNKDGKIEIVTVGYVNNPKNSSGQLRVWQLDGADLALKANAEWRMVDDYSLDTAGNVMGNTMAYNVKALDVDGDSYPEIVTGGFTYDGAKAEAQLRIWNWTNGALNLEKSQEWATLDITELKSISISDVDSDGKKEIVTSGVTCGYGSFAENAPNKSRAELKIWGWDGNTLTLKLSEDWIVGEGVCAWNDGTGDVDNDGVVEIVTVGCMYVGTLCDPDLRIWSLPAESNFLTAFPYLPIAIAGIATAVLAAVAIYLFVRKRR